MELPGVGAVTTINALQALQLGRGTPAAAALTALVGQDVELLLQSVLPDGVQLQLPSGQSVLAQGQLPYPQGTQLLVRVVPAQNETGVRLQTLEARPPAALPILAPLLQGEASSLLGRLTQPDPPQELLPLVQLLHLLSQEPASAPAQAPNLPPLPTAPQLETSLREIPQTQLMELGRALGSAPQATPAQIAVDLEHWLQAAVKGKAPSQTEDSAIQQSLQNLVAGHPEIPKDQGGALLSLVRHLLDGARAQDKPAAPKSEVASSLPPAPTPRASGASIPAPSAAPQPAAAEPEHWEAWVKGSLQALGDPITSPREAPFHIAQSKEGTGFFEVPLPWSQGGSLQLWVEEDPPETHAAQTAPVQRVLLGLNFSRLGETRLGLAKGPFGLQVRVWAEHSELLQADQERMESELKALGATVDLQIRPLPSGAPSLRALVTGSTLQALG